MVVFNANEDKYVKNLQDAGINEDIIKIALKYHKENDKTKELQLLTKERCILLNKFHECQNQMNCLDYLIFELRKK